MWYTSLPGIASRHPKEEALCYCCDLNTMITEQFYKKPIKSGGFDIQKSPCLNLTHNVRLKDIIKLYIREHTSSVCVCPCLAHHQEGKAFVEAEMTPFQGITVPYHSTPHRRLIAHLFGTIQSPRPDLTFNKDVCLKYADLAKYSRIQNKRLFSIGAAEVDTMAQCDPLAPPALDSVYKVPTRLISAPITPEL